MTADHHPEELIDRARRGALDPEQRSTLDRHLATCAACAAHLTHGARFEQELAPQPRDESLQRRSVEAAMLRMQRSPVDRRRAWPRWFRLAAAGVLLASGVTATAAIVARRMSARSTVDSLVPRDVAPAAARPAPIPAAARPAPAAVSPDPPEPAESPRPSATPPRAAPVRPTVTAAALFERAGKLSREGHPDAAIAAYRHLQRTFPDARETRLSFALAGQLLLERGRPSEALAQFDRHPRVDGAVGGDVDGDVGEEALAGRAAALEQLHRTGDAIAAWKSLLDRYPGSVYAGRARARLAQLVDRR